MNFRSAGVKLVALYCALLLVLGASFAWFTITSFDRYTRETVTRSIDARASEIWHTAKGSLDDRAALAQLIELRFAPEAQEHFIRISEKGRVLYLSAVPDGPDIAAFDRAGLPTANVTRNARYGLLLVHIQSFAGADGRRVTVESGQSNSFAQGLKRSLTQSMIFGLPVLLVLAALGGYVFMRESVRPLEVMAKRRDLIGCMINQKQHIGDAIMPQSIELALQQWNPCNVNQRLRSTIQTLGQSRPLAACQDHGLAHRTQCAWLISLTARRTASAEFILGCQPRAARRVTE